MGLQRRTGRTQALDRVDAGTVRRDCERQAREDSRAVNVYRTCSALPLVAAFLRAGQMQALAQGVQNGGTRIEFQFAGMTVDDESD